MTTLNRIGACASYQSFKSSRNLLASYAVTRAEDGETPLPSNLSRDAYVQGGMDNSDFADTTSSLSPVSLKPVVYEDLST